MPIPPDHTGRVLARRYRLRSVIGTGGFGRVYRAHDERLETAVAVKVIDPLWARDPEWVDRFAQEAKTAAKIAHPGVVRVTDTGTDARVGPFTVAELVEGPSLRAVLDRDGALPWPRAVELVAQAADALAAAHDRGVVHRDVKPGNLLLDRGERVRVCDFGIARLQTGLTTTSASHTLAGTPHYMAPEQALGKATGPAADQYALGVVAFELLTGRVPFQGDSPVAIGLAHVSEPPPKLPASLPAHVRRAVERALAKAPCDRHPDIRAFAAALARRDDDTVPLVGEEPTYTLRPSDEPATAATIATARRRAVRRIAAGCLVLALAGVTAAALARGGQDPERDGGAAARSAATAEPTTTLSPSRTATRTATPAPKITVPRLKGLPESSARSRAQRRGLTVDTVRRHSIRQAAGQVVSQRPAPGARVEDGETVHVTISTGPPPIKIPDLAGMSVTSARDQLSNLGLTASTRETVSARGVGTVLRTAPTGGSSVSRGSQVTLVVARAKRWRAIGTYTLDSDGSTPSFRVSGKSWRIVYSLTELSCEYDVIDCSKPSLQIDQTDGYEIDSVELSAGAHTTYGPDGPGRFRLTLNGYSGEWQLSARVEQFS